MSCCRMIQNDRTFLEVHVAQREDNCNAMNRINVPRLVSAAPVRGDDLYPRDVAEPKGPHLAGTGVNQSKGIASSRGKLRAIRMIFHGARGESDQDRLFPH